MNEFFPIDLQLFSAGLDEEDLGYEDEDEGTPEAEPIAETLTPEQENEKLRATVKAQGDELSTFKGVIDELKSRPAERIIERERAAPVQRTESNEDRARRSADLAIKLGTDPESILAEVRRESANDAKRAILEEAGEEFGDTIIDRFERKRKEKVPLVGDKVAAVFRASLDALGPDAKKALVLMPASQREAALELHWKAAGYEYLEPKIKPRVKTTASTDMGGRTAGAAPGPRATKGFSFTDSQKEGMRRAGMSNEKIAAREKAVREGLV